MKNGQPLQIEMLYDNQSRRPELTIYQEDLRKVGISVNLRLVTFETHVQLIEQLQFRNGGSGGWGVVTLSQSRDTSAFFDRRHE